MHQILNVNCIKVEPCLALQRLAAAWKKTGQLTRGRPEKFSWCGLQSKDAGCNCNPHYNVTSTFRSSEVWPVLRHVAKEKNTLGKSCSASTFFFFLPIFFCTYLLPQLISVTLPAPSVNLRCKTCEAKYNIWRFCQHFPFAQRGEESIFEDCVLL